MSPAMRALVTLLEPLAALPASPVRAAVIGADQPASFSVCEAATDPSGAPREECQGGDVRFQAAPGARAASDFGFAVASGRLNGDALDDLVVGDPKTNKVYIFFGRASATAAYHLHHANFDTRPA